MNRNVNMAISADDMKERIAKKLDEEHKIFLMNCLARNMTFRETREELKTEYNISISTVRIAQLKEQPKYREFFDRYHEKYMQEYENIKKIHLSAKVNRLKEADNVASGINKIIGIIQKKLDSEGMTVNGETSGKKYEMETGSRKVDTYVMNLTRQLVQLTDSYIQILKYCKEETKKEKKSPQEAPPAFLTQINIGKNEEEHEEPQSIEIEKVTDEKQQIQEHASHGVVSEDI